MKKDERKSLIKTGLEHETRVLLENMYSNIKKISENQALGNQRLDKIEEKVAKIDTIEVELNTVKLAVMDTSKEVKTLNNKVGALDTNLKRVEVTLSADIKRVENKLDKNLDNHEKRLTKLEEKVFAA